MLYIFHGFMGGGKTLGMLYNTLEICEKRKRDGIVSNQQLNRDAIIRYAGKKKWWHLMKVAVSGRILWDPHSNLNTMLTYKNAVVMIDEAGIFANARDVKEVKNNHPHFFTHLVQARKIGIDLSLAAQSYTMIDPFIRQITNTYVACDFIPPLDLWIRQYFSGEGNFEGFLRTKKWFKYQDKIRAGILDYDLAACYDTMARLEDADFKGNEIPRTPRNDPFFEEYERVWNLGGAELRETVQIMHKMDVPPKVKVSLLRAVANDISSRLTSR